MPKNFNNDMRTVTEMMPVTGELRTRNLTKEDLDQLFKGVGVTVRDEGDGTFTHTIDPQALSMEDMIKIQQEQARLNPPTTPEDQIARAGYPSVGGTPPNPSGGISPDEFAKMYQEQLRAISPAEYQTRFMGTWEAFLPAGTRFEEITITNVEPDPKPNVWERLKTWLTEAQTRTIEVPMPRRTYENDYLAAMCTAHRNMMTGRNPRRGGRQAGRTMMAAVIHEDFDRMIREGSMIAGADFGQDAGGQAAALRSEIGSFNTVRIVRSMPNADEAEARWQTATNVGELHV